MKPIELTAYNFATFIENNELVLVDFWAPWCSPCRSFAPIFDLASVRHPKIAFAKVNTETQSELARAAKVASIPTLRAFKNGILVHSKPGALNTGDLEQLIEQFKTLTPNDHQSDGRPANKETTMRTADEATRKRILNRLKRARGQLDAVINAVETDGSCREVVTQLSAVSTALDRAGFAIVSTAMQYCIADPEKASKEEDGLSVEELEKVFLSLS